MAQRNDELAGCESEVDVVEGWRVAGVALTRGRLGAYVASLVAGCFYGLTFAPVIHIQNDVPGSSPNGLVAFYPHSVT